jgi:pimeloyl-ACP methyl ester carboxylesterase
MRTRPRLLVLLLAATLALGLGSLVPATAGPGISPPGANDWGCRPDARHPQPVVLVNGTFETMDKNWVTMSPYLADAGYCVFAFNYGNRATGPIPRSAKQLRRFVEKVREATGSRKVDLVGHSQGGMMPRYYLRFLGGANRVDDLVGLAPSNHGTTMSMDTGGTSPCRACEQQARGSRFLRRLNADGDTVPGPDYTVVSTQYDEVVTPYRSQFLRGPERRVTNTVLQDVCATDTFEHDQMPNDPVAQQIVRNALRVDGPAREAFQPECVPVP